MMNLQNDLRHKRRKYVREWENDALFFYENQHYDWMCENVKLYQNIIEIGCGVGYSTLALVNNGHKVIAVDENIECLKATKKTLKSNGIESKIIQREALFKESKNYYEYSLQKIKNLDFSDTVILIEGDLIKDPNLKEWLEKQEINCIVAWLIGSHGARKFNKSVAELNLNSPLEYRIAVQRRIYELADSVLKSNGALHIIDRCKFPENDKEKEKFYIFHKNMAAKTTLNVHEPTFNKYEHEIDGGVEMSSETDDIILRHEKLSDIALISSLAIKR